MFIPKVFISYSHDSPEHAQRVLDLSNRLREWGVDCNIDQYEPFPPEGWPRWMEQQIQAPDFVLMVCTETYYRRAGGNEKPGAGLGVCWEAGIIYNHLYVNQTQNHKFIPILLTGGKTEDIPEPVRQYSYYRVDTEEGFDNLYRLLTHQPKTEKPALGLIKPMPSRERNVKFQQPFNIPYPRNPFFTGREDVIANIHETLTTKGAAAINQIQAICGLGGIGKTQTAVEYAYHFRDNYQVVLWEAANSKESLISGYVSLAQLLNLPEADAQDQLLAVNAIKNWLERTSDWLLILDNADEPELLVDFIPANPKGHILVTSRNQVFDSLGITNPVSLDEMQPNEAKAFLLKRTGRNNLLEVEQDALTKLVKELAYLPLALEQAGAYIYKHKCSFQDYLQSYEKQGLKLLEKMKPVAGKYPESVLTTWAINFDQVKARSFASAELLTFCAFLDPEFIPLELFILGAKKLGPNLDKILVDADSLKLDEILEPLTQYSLIIRDISTRSIKIHRLVQAVLHSMLIKKKQRLWAGKVIRVVNKAFPSPEFPNWPLCTRLLSQVQMCANLIVEWDIQLLEAARLLNAYGLYLMHHARYIEADSLYKQSLQMYKKISFSEHGNTATILNNLGLTYYLQERYGEAEQFYQRSLEIREKVLGPNHQDVAVSLSCLGVLYVKMGRYNEAELLYQRALAIDEKVFGSEHQSIAVDLNNLAGLYTRIGEYSKAETFYQRSLSIWEKEIDPRHPDVASILNNLAALYYTLGSYEEAESFCQRSLSIKEKAFDPNHPDIALCLENYAAILRATDRESAATELEDRARQIRKKQKLISNPPTE